MNKVQILLFWRILIEIIKPAISNIFDTFYTRRLWFILDAHWLRSAWNVRYKFTTQRFWIRNGPIWEIDRCRFRYKSLPNDFENKGEGDSFGAAPLSLFDWDPRGPRPFNQTFYIETPRGVNELKDSDWNFYFRHNN